jgi:hypothetical protein
LLVVVVVVIVGVVVVVVSSSCNFLFLVFIVGGGGKCGWPGVERLESLCNFYQILLGSIVLLLDLAIVIKNIHTYFL